MLKLALSILSAFMAVALLVHASTRDGLPAETLLFFAGDDTRYSASYTEEAFEQIEVGATESAVLAALGEPLQTREAERGVRYLYYSESRGGGHFRVRTLKLNEGRVVEVHSTVFID